MHGGNPDYFTIRLHRSVYERAKAYQGELMTKDRATVTMSDAISAALEAVEKKGKKR